MAESFYRIKDWASRYETSETRKLKSLTYVKLNNKMDGLAFRLLSKNQDAPSIFCAWILMLELASKSTPRGDLKHNNLPLSPGEMGEITGFPGEIFERALVFLCDQKIGWIEKVSPSPDAPGENPDAPGNSPGTPPDKLIGVKGIKEESIGSLPEYKIDPQAAQIANEAAGAYPRYAKDGRQVQGFTTENLSKLVAAVKRAPDFPWVEAAGLEKQNDYPTDFGKWLAMMPDPVWLEAKRGAPPKPKQDGPLPKKKWKQLG